MAPIYWILGVIAIVALWRHVNSTNRNRVFARRSTELARENDHLRHVVSELSMDKHKPRW